MTAVRLDRRGRAVTLTLDRPPLNVLDLAALGELGERLRELETDDGVQLLVVRGAGGRAFSAGVAVEDHTRERAPRMLERFHRALAVLGRLRCVTLAVVEGHCLGGGMELATACDLLLAADGSRFGQPEIEVGCYPPFAAAAYPRRLGGGRTLELLLTGRRLDCAEAERLGIVTHRAPACQLEARLEELTETILSKSAAVTGLLKRAVREGCERPFAEALAATERLYLDELLASADVEEGVAAFLEKRSPRWKHQ